MDKLDCVIKPITEDDVECISGTCWDSDRTQKRILAQQGILGLAAWQGDLCVGLLHCYRVSLPRWDDALFPAYGRKSPRNWPLGWPLLAAKEKAVRVEGPVWAHACFHVGFVGPESEHADRAYFGRGIGTALCQASIQWAREHDYAAVLAQGGTKAAWEYNVWMGCLPWTTYARLGFDCVAVEEDGQRLPWWTEGEATLAVHDQVQQAVSQGCDPTALCARTMLLRF